MLKIQRKREVIGCGALLKLHGTLMMSYQKMRWMDTTETLVLDQVSIETELCSVSALQDGAEDLPQVCTAEYAQMWAAQHQG